MGSSLETAYALPHGDLIVDVKNCTRYSGAKTGRTQRHCWQGQTKMARGSIVERDSKARTAPKGRLVPCSAHS